MDRWRRTCDSAGVSYQGDKLSELCYLSLNYVGFAIRCTNTWRRGESLAVRRAEVRSVSTMLGVWRECGRITVFILTY